MGEPPSYRTVPCVWYLVGVGKRVDRNWSDTTLEARNRNAPFFFFFFFARCCREERKKTALRRHNAVQCSENTTRYCERNGMHDELFALCSTLVHVLMISGWEILFLRKRRRSEDRLL